MATALFFFRRDLRLEDNTALQEAAKEYEIIPAFCFDPRQVDDNEYRADNAVQFMLESLESLDQRIRNEGGKLHFFHSKPRTVVEQLADDIDAVFFNKDYTPFSKKRDTQIQHVCKSLGIHCESYHDAFLTVPGQVLTGSGTTYKVFTPFKKRAVKEHDVRKPTSTTPSFVTVESEDTQRLFEHVLAERKDTLKCKGGREHALPILENIEKYEEYEEEREYPFLDKTTHLSPYLKFGCISAREVYWAVREVFGQEHSLITELYWRDFYGHLLDSYPRILNSNMKEKYDAVPWRKDEEGLQRWKEGRTGFPIVDAAMRQLVKTGWMHNRCRMIVACFLCKDLRIHWKEGERFFAQHLIDYDPASNNGGWQWAASTGADSQPYFRIFNPWSQQEKYDKECEYIKKFVPELRELEPSDIHDWNTVQYGDIEYPAPILNHKEASKKTKQIFKNAIQ